MQVAAISENEQARKSSSAIRDLDTEAEAEYDGFVKLAS